MAFTNEIETASRQTQVSCALLMLAKAMEDARATQGKIFERLESVLEPSVPECDAPVMKSGPELKGASIMTAPLAVRIQDSAIEIGKQVRAYEAMLKRLEL